MKYTLEVMTDAMGADDGSQLRKIIRNAAHRIDRANREFTHFLYDDYGNCVGKSTHTNDGQASAVMTCFTCPHVACLQRDCTKTAAPAACPFNNIYDILEAAQCIMEFICDTFHRDVTNAQRTPFSENLVLLLDSLGWDEIRTKLRAFKVINTTSTAFYTVRDLPNVGCFDWGFVPWFVTTCIGWDEEKPHFLDVLPDWRERLTVYTEKLGKSSEEE